jgi:hypothetical protein
MEDALTQAHDLLTTLGFLLQHIGTSLILTQAHHLLTTLGFLLQPNRDIVNPDTGSPPPDYAWIPPTTNRDIVNPDTGSQPPDYAWIPPTTHRDIVNTNNMFTKCIQENR